MYKKNPETSGERAVKAELKYLGLKFRQEEKIYDLKADAKKSFRVADFYLKDHDIYIEFLGEWNRSNRDKQRYKEKMRVYKLNDIKCIWIYPDNLTHTHKKIQDGLIKYGVKFKRHSPDKHLKKKPVMISPDPSIFKQKSEKTKPPRTTTKVKQEPLPNPVLKDYAIFILLGIIIVLTIGFLAMKFIADSRIEQPKHTIAILDSTRCLDVCENFCESLNLSGDNPIKHLDRGVSCECTCEDGEKYSNVPS